MERKETIQNCIQPLLSWYRQAKRDLPWRSDPTPYHIWLSEIIFQQTRIEAGTAYYLRFLREAPTVRDFADLSEDRLLKLWEGLGYYNRARNMHKTAKLVSETYGGTFPDEPAELEKLPGIGRYTAGAISSIAFGKPVPAVDGNVLRVFARVLADTSDIAKPETKRALEKELAEIYKETFSEAGSNLPGDLNQAIMDLGATVCIPNGAPHCSVCPLAGICRANAENLQEKLPVKSPQKSRKIEERTVFVIRYQKMKWPGEPAYSEPAHYYIRKRPETGLLANLWELPGEEGVLTGTAVKQAIRRLIPDADTITWEPLGQAKHVFSHIEWHMTGYLVDIQPAPTGLLLPDTLLKDTSGSPLEAWKTKDEIEEVYSLPSAFRAYRAYIR